MEYYGQGPTMCKKEEARATTVVTMFMMVTLGYHGTLTGEKPKSETGGKGI